MAPQKASSGGANGGFSFVDYLESLPAAKVDVLYGSRWTCAALLRALPPLGKQCVLRLLHVDAPLSIAELRAWVREEVVAQQDGALRKLRSLRVLLPSAQSAGGGAAGSEQAFSLHPSLRAHLREALYDVSPQPTPALPESLQRLAPSSAQLHTLANEKWETLLLFLVGQGEAPAAEHGSTLDIGALLRGAGLVVTACEAAQASGVPLDADDDPAALAVSDAGFRYLLLERSQQLWLLLQHYVALSDALAGDPAAVLDVLLHLSFLPPHVPQPVPDPAQLTLLGDMATLGMVHIFGTQPDALWFCVTPLASAVSAGLAASGGARAMEGHIIVETNFRVYAYTSSLIELAILNFFVRHEYTLPNLFVGALTRESVIEAHRNGISAEQVVSYLQSHAHPHVAGRVPTVPETVSDQIRLWARDTQRLRASPATLYDDFPSDRAFGAAKAHAQGLGALLWADDTRRTMVANQEVQGAMREWFRVQREQGTHT